VNDDTDAIRVLMPEMPTLEGPVRTRPGIRGPHDPERDHRDNDLGIPAGRVVMSVEEAAALLGISRTAAYEAVRRGQIPSRRIGRRIVIPVPMMRAWLGLGIDSPPDSDRGDVEGSEA